MSIASWKKAQAKTAANHKADAASGVNSRVNKHKGTRRAGQTVEECPEKAAQLQKSPVNTNVVCDSVILKLLDQTSEKSLMCCSHDESPVGRNVPRHVAVCLMHYDLVMELVSDYEIVTKLEDLDTEPTEDYKNVASKKKFVNLQISRAGKGECPNHDHPSVKMIALDRADAGYSRYWNTRTPEVVRLPARALTWDERLAWIGCYWRFGKDTREFAVTAEGCGVGVESPVNYQLKGLVRVFANDKWELTLKLPPLKKWEREKERMRWKDKTMNSGSQSSSTFGKATFEETYERIKAAGKQAEWKSTRGRTVNGHYEEREASYKHGTLERKPVKRTDYSAEGLFSYTTEGEEDSVGQTGTSASLDLKHNGESLNVVKKLQGIVQTALHIRGTIKKLIEAVECLPKIGVTHKFDASIFEGSITGTWGNRPMDGPNGSGPRYIAVESYFDIDVQIKLFELSFDLGFGFELKVPAILEWFDAPSVEIVLKAAVKTSAELAINYKALSSSKDNHKVSVETEPGLTVYIEFKVNVMGKGLDADAGVRGGIKAEGSFHVSFSHAPDFELDAGMKPIEVYARYFVDALTWDISGHWEHVLVDGRPFYKGPIPLRGETVGAAPALQNAEL